MPLSALPQVVPLERKGQRPRLTVSVATYNHAPFIRQALDSALMQQTNFPFEILVGDDGSTDGTRQIVEQYDQRFPGRFRLLLNARNTGPSKMGPSVLSYADGDYVALLDGDDYWTDSRKLQTQVDFLEANLDFAVSFHNVCAVPHSGRGGSHLLRAANQPRTSSVEDLLASNFIPACSMVFRNGLSRGLPDWYFEIQNRFNIGDWPLSIFNALSGRIGYLPDVWGVYRMHGGGIWSSSTERLNIEKNLGVLGVLGEHLDPRYNSAILAGVAHWSLELAMACAREGASGAMATALFRSAELAVELRRWPSRRALGALVRAPVQLAAGSWRKRALSGRLK